MDAPSAQPDVAEVPGERRLLTDRAALKLSLWTLAGLAVWFGVSSFIVGSEMTYEAEPAVMSEPICDPPAAEPAEGEAASLCFFREVTPARIEQTAEGKWLQAQGIGAVAAAFALLVYQGLRWNPSRVGPWFTPAPKRQPDVPASDLGAAADGAAEPPQG